MPSFKKSPKVTSSRSRRIALSQRIVASEPVIERLGPRSTPIRAASVIRDEACAVLKMERAIKPAGRLLIALLTIATMPPTLAAAAASEGAALRSASANVTTTPVCPTASTKTKRLT